MASISNKQSLDHGMTRSSTGSSIQTERVEPSLYLHISKTIWSAFNPSSFLDSTELIQNIKVDYYPAISCRVAILLILLIGVDRTFCTKSNSRASLKFRHNVNQNRLPILNSLNHFCWFNFKVGSNFKKITQKRL